jgi:hypothetical protein
VRKFPYHGGKHVYYHAVLVKELAEDALEFIEEVFHHVTEIRIVACLSCSDVCGRRLNIANCGLLLILLS